MFSEMRGPSKYAADSSGKKAKLQPPPRPQKSAVLSQTCQVLLKQHKGALAAFSSAGHPAGYVALPGLSDLVRPLFLEPLGCLLMPSMAPVALRAGFLAADA